MNNNDFYEYLKTFKNPLDKKWRWEVNTAFKQNKITDFQRKQLLKILPHELYELSVCVRNNVNMDPRQVGNFYIKRATDYNLRKQRKQEEKIQVFSNGESIVR